MTGGVVWSEFEEETTVSFQDKEYKKTNNAKNALGSTRREDIKFGLVC